MCGTAAGDRPPLLALLRVSGGVADWGWDQ